VQIAREVLRESEMLDQDDPAYRLWSEMLGIMETDDDTR
jgi:hypothetical protein